VRRESNVWNEPRGTATSSSGPLLVLLNPSARAAAASIDARGEIAARLRARGLSCTLVETYSDASARAQAEEAARSGMWRAVVAAGGDGTVHAVATGLLAGSMTTAGGEPGAPQGHPERRVALGILPLGTMNNLAHSLGIPEDLDAACDIVAAAAPRPLDVGTIGDHIFLELAGAGLEAALYPYAEALKGRRRAHPGVVRDALRVLSALKPVPVTLDVDGRRVHVRALQVSICNAPRYGADFAAAPDARLDDGWLDVVIYERFSWLELFGHYVSIMGGRRDLRARVRRLRARRAIIMPHATRWEVHADGEPVGKTPVAVTVAPGALPVLAPPRSSQNSEPDGLGPVEALVRAATPPGAPIATRAALMVAGRTGESLAHSTKHLRQAVEATSDEARELVGVESEPHSARRAGIVRAIYLAAFAGAMVMTVAVGRAQLLPGDVQIMRAVQRRRSPLRDRFWRAVAAPGFPAQSTPLVIMSAAVFLALRLRVEALFIILASGTNVVSWLIKRLVRRQRPTHEQAHVAQVINEPGFPSGHVMHYLSFYGFLAAAALANLRPSRLRRVVVGVCTAMIGLVGPSRVYLGAHWPSDVAAGYLFGGLYLGGLLEAYARVKRKMSADRETS